MGRNRFVVPKVTRLPLSDGDWIEVKDELTVGEARAVTQSFVGVINPDGSRTPNRETLGMGQVFAHLVDWSLKDANDKPVPLTMDALKALSLDDFREIDDALDRHLEAVDAAKKKIPMPAAAGTSATS